MPPSPLVPQKGAVLVNTDAVALMERVPADSVTIVYLDPPSIPRGHFGSPDDDRRWRSYMTAVIQEAHRTLRDEGSLFVSIHENSAFDTELIVRQVFDREVYRITRPGFPFRGSISSRPVSRRETTLLAQKSERSIWNAPTRSHNPMEQARFNKQDERGRYSLHDLTTVVMRPSLSYEWQGVNPPAGRSWRVTRERMDELFASGYIERSAEGLPRQKRYLSQMAEIPVGLDWDEIPVLAPRHERVENDGHVFAAAQPLAFAVRVVQAGSSPGDLVLDPFCGSGTSLVAALQEGRRWTGGDLGQFAVEMTLKRAEQQTVKPNQLLALSANELDALPIAAGARTEVVASVADIAAIHRKVGHLEGELELLQVQREQLDEQLKSLTDALTRFKETLGISDDLTPDEAVAIVEARIQEIVKLIPYPQEAYVERIREWLDEWDRLDAGSQTYLPQAEMLLDWFASSGIIDFSPSVLQFCRVIENELLVKLFSAYNDDLNDRRGPELTIFLEQDISNPKTNKFARSILSRNKRYTMGTMRFIMSLIEIEADQEETQSSPLRSSPLLQDFLAYIHRYFTDQVLASSFLQAVGRITNEFRNKAAHPGLIDLARAQECQREVRLVIQAFMRSYRGDRGASDGLIPQ